MATLTAFDHSPHSGAVLFRRVLGDMLQVMGLWMTELVFMHAVFEPWTYSA